MAAIMQQAFKPRGAILSNLRRITQCNLTKSRTLILYPSVQKFTAPDGPNLTKSAIRTPLTRSIFTSSPAASESDSQASHADPGSSQFLVNLQGMPWQATEKDVLAFLEGCEVMGGESGIHIAKMLNNPNRSQGWCIVEMASQEDMDRAMEKDRENMGSRYINVRSARDGQLERAKISPKMSASEMFNPSGERSKLPYRPGFYVPEGATGSVLLVMNLPPRTTHEEVVGYFPGHEVVPGGVATRAPIGNQALVQFESTEKARRAIMARSNPELFIWLTELQNLDSYTIEMQGTPFDLNEDDVHKFFEPLEVAEVTLLRKSNGYALGNSLATFKNLDQAQQAMGKDSEFMGERYIQLSMFTKPEEL